MLKGELEREGETERAIKRGRGRERGYDIVNMGRERHIKEDLGENLKKRQE